MTQENTTPMAPDRHDIDDNPDSADYAPTDDSVEVVKDSLTADAAAVREALAKADAAIAEYYRYWTGGETRGSYDGKPEREQLWKAQHAARAALARSESLR